MSKGSNRRPGDAEKYNSNWDLIWGKKPETKPKPKPKPKPVKKPKAS